MQLKYYSYLKYALLLKVVDENFIAAFLISGGLPQSLTILKNKQGYL